MSLGAILLGTAVVGGLRAAGKAAEREEQERARKQQEWLDSSMVVVIRCPRCGYQEQRRISMDKKTTDYICSCKNCDCDLYGTNVIAY